MEGQLLSRREKPSYLSTSSLMMKIFKVLQRFVDRCTILFPIYSCLIQAFLVYSTFNPSKSHETVAKDVTADIYSLIRAQYVATKNVKLLTVSSDDHPA